MDFRNAVQSGAGGRMQAVARFRSANNIYRTRIALAALPALEEELLQSHDVHDGSLPRLLR